MPADQLRNYVYPELTLNIYAIPEDVTYKAKVLLVYYSYSFECIIP